MRVRPPVLAVSSIVVFALVVEIVVRLAGPDLSTPAAQGQFRFDVGPEAARAHHVRDPELGWRLAPGGAGGIRTNSRGFRGAEFADRKPPGVLRIVFIGDSNPMGFGLTDESHPYPSRVCEILTTFVGDRLGAEVECINLGVDAYSSLQARRVAERYVPLLRPDFVCVQVGFNDYCYASVADADRHFERPPVLRLLDRSHAYRWLRRVLLARTPRWSGEPVRRVSPQAFEANVRAIVAIANEIGARPILITTPVNPNVPLVINEERIQSGDDEIWMTEDRWAKGMLQQAGVVPPDSLTHERYIPETERLLNAHPDWPILAWMLSAAHAEQGDSAAAQTYDAMWRRLDTERAVLASGYREPLDRTARDTGAELVDVAALLDAYRAEVGEENARGLYLDFVHLDPRGHVVVATELARRIVSAVAGEASGDARDPSHPGGAAVPGD